MLVDSVMAGDNWIYPTSGQCGCCRGEVVGVRPSADLQGIETLGPDGRVCCSAFEGEYPDQHTEVGLEAARRQCALTGQHIERQANESGWRFRGGDSAESLRFGEFGRTEPFCACGRVVSQCDGSRRGRRTRAFRCSSSRCRRPGRGLWIPRWSR